MNIGCASHVKPNPSLAVAEPGALRLHMPLLAAIQMVSTPDVEQNLTAAARLIALAADRGATFVALPEYFCLLGSTDADRLRIAEPDGDGRIQRVLADLAIRHQVWLLGGTVPIHANTRGHARNASCLFAPDGTRVARYDKIHLFAFDNGREAYDESAILEAGDAPVRAVAGEMSVGLSVCYDLRFPELFRRMTFAAGQPPLDLICAPSAFTWTTGRQHWEILLRARAVENQCYVIAPAQGGIHANGTRTWGHSMIVDPWGDVLDCVTEGEGVAMAALDAGRLAEVRRRLPALQHRRL
jgi:deaminated glutathione amidase